MWDKIADQPLKFSGQIGTFFFTFLEKIFPFVDVSISVLGLDVSVYKTKFCFVILESLKKKDNWSKHRI